MKLIKIAMKEFLLPTVALMASLSAAQAQYFTPGNLAVVQMGTAAQPAGADGEPVSLVQFTPAGVQVGTPLTLPSTGANAFILDNSATEGFMTLSGNGAYLVLGGYNTNIQTTNSIANFTSTNIYRAVATVDGYGNFALPITNSHIYSTYNLRGAVSDGLGNFWVSGSGGTGATIANGEIGIVYVGSSNLETNVTVTETGTGNERCLNLYNNTLYLSTGSGSGLYGRGIYMVSNSASGGIMTNTGSTANNTNILQTGSTSGPYDFIINAAGTIAYVAEDNLGGIIKFTSTGLPGALWVSNYTISALTPGAPAADTNAEAVTADFTQNPPVIYATTGEGVGDRLIQIVDNGPTSTATLLATAPAGAIYRGVRFVPASYPVISTPPVAAGVDAGQTASFSVGVTGTPPFTYQWYSNNVAIPLATNSSLNLLNPNIGQSGTQIYVAVSNSVGGASSTPVTLTVSPPGPPANIVVTPGSQTINAGATATFTASVVGAPQLYYGWTQNGIPLTDSGNISGSATATLTITGAVAANDGSYEVLVTNSLGYGSNAISATLQVVDPAIETGPMGATNLPGAAGPVLSVTATGSGTLTYQWYSNNVAITGANSSTYTVPSSGSTTQASYTVTVSNGSGNSTTSAATVVSFTPVLLWDGFNYPNGNLVTNGPWTDINGSNPELVINNRVQVAQTNATTDIITPLSSQQSGQVMWVSFTINMTTLPTNAGGVYFANLADTNFGFVGRIFALTSNAFPGTYRLGIGDESGDYSSATHTGGPSKVMPLDMAPGIDYQVVYMYDDANAYGQLWVNPSSTSDVNSGYTTDTGSTSLPLANFNLRQRQGEGIMTLDNLLVSLDYAGVGSGFAVVATNVPALPVIGFQPVGTTNYSGDNWTMEVAASGMGLTYSWALNNTPLSDDGVTIIGSATPTLSLANLSSASVGTYTVTVQNSVGPTVSSPTIVSVNSTLTLPIVSVLPTSVSTAVGSSATFTASATGTGPLSYQWFYYNGTAYTQLQDGTIAGTTISGSQTSVLTLSGFGTNATGGYVVKVTGGAGTTPSLPAQLTVVPPASVSISFLRSLINPTTYAVSDGTTLYNVTGTITTRTNLTSGNTASYYLQDSTGGINLFVTFGSAFRPNLGDVVTATGVASSYGDNLEIDVDDSNPQQVYSVLTNSDGSAMTNALPAPIVFPWGYQTVNEPFTVTNIEGSVIMLTNAYFTNTGTFASGVTYNVFSHPNGGGISYPLYLSAQVTDAGIPGQSIVGQPIPPFAYSITGPIAQASASVYEIELTSYAQIVSAPPPAAPAAAALSGTGKTNLTLSWTSVPYNYSYSILYSTNVTGPYQSLASGFTFTNTLGAFTDVHRTNSARFYQITTP
jgi:hypothetical protein